MYTILSYTSTCDKAAQYMDHFNEINFDFIANGPNVSFLFLSLAIYETNTIMFLHKYQR